MTIKDIARLCQVSTSTVSRAINGDPGINAETKARILQTIEEHHFVPNNNARNLKMIEANTVGLLVKGIDNPFFQGMFTLFEKELKEEDFSFIPYSVPEDQDEVQAAEELFKEKKLKGLILLGGNFEGRNEHLDRFGIPYVRCTGATLPGDSFQNGASVSIDDEKEGYRVVDYLCRKGHKRIAFISLRENDSSVGYLRLQGYKKALEDHGIPYDPNLVFLSETGVSPYSMESGYHSMKKLIQDKMDCTAVFALSDVAAFGVYKAIHESGLKIPEDYSVIGFDGLPFSDFFHPSLTTIRQPFEKMVAATIQELVKAIKGKKYEHQLQFEAAVIERDSVCDV